MTVPLLQADSAGLTSQLWRLARFIRDQAKEAKTRGELVETTEIVVHRRLKKFEYKDGGNISISWHDEFLQRPRLHWKKQQHFMETVTKPSPAFQDCAKLLVQDSSPGASHGPHLLEQFAGAIAAESCDECSDERLVEYIARFTSDLSNAPVDMCVSAWVDGLWLKDECIRLPNLLFRRPTPLDLESERPLSIALCPGFEPLPQLFGLPAIVEFTCKAASPITVQEEVMRLMGALRLYRLGAVEAVSYSISPNSLSRFGGTHGAALKPRALDRYPLGGEDKEPLDGFISKMRPLVPERYGEGTSQLEPADLGFLRFSDAVLQWGDVEGRITSAITCLEALFLKAKERSELSHKLSLRVACLLRLLKLNAIQVQGHVHQAYEIRSTYIHGGQAEKDRLRDARDLCREVLEYARLRENGDDGRRRAEAQISVHFPGTGTG